MIKSSKLMFVRAFGIMVWILYLIDSSLGQNRVASLPDDTLATEEDRCFIRRTYELAKSAVAHGNHPFGALLVYEGKILAEFENKVVTSRDLTKHAETGLIGSASRDLSREVLSESTLYTSTEPCLMCGGAIFWAGIKKIVFGTSEHQMDLLIDSDSRNHRIPSRELFKRIRPDMVIIGPVLEEEGLALHAEFCLNSERGRGSEPTQWRYA